MHRPRIRCRMPRTVAMVRGWWWLVWDVSSVSACALPHSSTGGDGAHEVSIADAADGTHLGDADGGAHDALDRVGDVVDAIDVIDVSDGSDVADVRDAVDAPDVSDVATDD